jgi:transposase InsO family protein
MKQKDLSRRQARWAEFISPYAPIMDIVYKKGELNQADALSRRPDLTKQLDHLFHGPIEEAAAMITALVSSPVADQSLLEQIKTGYTSDSYYAADNPKRLSFVKLSPDGFYRVGARIAVPHDAALRLKILHEFHDVATAGHPGVIRTLASISQHFWWPHMTRAVRSYVRACSTCQRIKPSHEHPGGLLQPLPVPERPWTHVSLDLITDLPTSGGYNSLVVVVDTFSKMAHFFPTNKTVTAKQLADQFTREIYRLHGLPKVLISDRDPRFTSDFWTDLFKRLGTKLNMSTAYHPETDGQTERTNRTLEQILRAYAHPYQDDWYKHLDLAEFAYNRHPSASTGMTPFQVVYGYNPDTPVTLHATSTSDPDAKRRLEPLKDIQALVRENLRLAKETQAAYANRSRQDTSFKEGDLVKLNTAHLKLKGQKSKKLKDRFIGPFPIAEVIGWVGGSNGIWIIFPLIGMYASFQLIQTGTFNVFRNQGPSL